MSNIVSEADARKRVTDALAAVEWFAELISAETAEDAHLAVTATDSLKRLGWDVRRIHNAEGGGA